MSISQNFPAISPTLNLNFARSKKLDPRITFTRTSSATRTNAQGLIEVVSADTPRFEHSYNSSTGSVNSLGLLVEESRTNSIRNNTMVGAVAGTPGTNPTSWTYATAQSNGLTVSIVGTGIENGINYIDYRFNGTTVASPFACAIGIDNASAATAQTWTASLYWKLASGTTTGITNWQIGVIENTSGAAFVSGAFYTQTSPTSAALITQRPAATRTLSGGATVGMVSYPLNIPVAGNTAIDFTIRLGMPQLEQGAFVTSVIPTVASTRTRAADNASMTGTNFTSWYNSSEGTLFAASRINALGGSNYPGIAYVDDGTSNNCIGFYINDAGSDTIGAEAYISNVAQYGLSSSATTANQLNKVISAYKVNDFAAAFNIGSNAVQTDTSGSVPTVNRLIIGDLRGSSAKLNGTISQLLYYPRRLTNTQLQNLTK